MTVSRLFRHALLTGALFLTSPLAQASYFSPDLVISKMANVLPAKEYRGTTAYATSYGGGGMVPCVVKVESTYQRVRVSMFLAGSSTPAAQFDSGDGLLKYDIKFVYSGGIHEIFWMKGKGPTGQYSHELAYTTRMRHGDIYAINVDIWSGWGSASCNILL